MHSSVSVIIPNYNRENFIGATIRNLLAQTLKPYEIIVVDDGSTDNSLGVIHSFGDKVKVLRQANKGPGAARNAGLRVATGEYIQFQDSDDFISLNKLETQVKKIQSTNADLVYGPFVKGFLEGGRFVPEDVALLQASLPGCLPLHEWVLRGLSIIFQACLIKHDFLRQYGAYRTDLMPSEDSELLFRMGLNGARLAYCPEVLTVYRLHHTNQITADGTTPANRLKDWARMLIIQHELLAERQVRLHWQTRLIALTELWNTSRWLRHYNCSEEHLIEKLERLFSGKPNWFYHGVKTCQRISARLRFERYGVRWQDYYRCGALTQGQLQLLSEIFKDTSHALV